MHVENEIMDDGGLGCLNLKHTDSRSFDCKQVKQEDFVNMTFMVYDVIDNVTTPRGSDRMVVLFKESENSDFLKFITSSRSVKEILIQVKAMGKFPRRVTLKKFGKSYTLK